MLSGLGAAVVEESHSEIVAPPIDETILIVATSSRSDQLTDLLGRHIRRPFPRHSVTVIPAGQPTWWLAPNKGMRQIHIHVQPNVIEKVGEERLMDLDRPRFAVEDATLGQIAGAIESALLTYSGTGLELYIEHLLLAFVMRTFSERADSRSARSMGLAPWALRTSVAYMNDNLAAPVQLSDLAQIAGLSPHHFARMFKQATGMTPHAFLTAARMEKARALLTRTSMPIVDVAALVGYSAPSTFARVFRAQVGVSPLQYRQINGPIADSGEKGEAG